MAIKYIEYIQGNGSAYITLGSFRMNRNYSVTGVAQIDTTAAHYIYGAYDGTHAYDFGFNLSQNAYLFRYSATTNRYLGTNSLFSFDQKIIFDLYRSPTTSDQTVISVSDYPNEETTYSMSLSRPSNANALTIPTFLMARNQNGSANNIANGSRLYSLQIFNYSIQSDPLYDLKPIRNTNTGQIGLIDIAQSTPVEYYAVTSNFIAGPDIDQGGNMWIRQSGGSWIEGTPYIRRSGSWQTGIPYLKQSGSWSQGS